MIKRWKRTAAVAILTMVMTIGASLPAFAANVETFETVSGATITISNIIETRQIEDVGYGETMYVATAPVTIKFNGELLTEETWLAKWADEESLEYVEIENNTATLTDPVRYGIFPAFEGESRSDNTPILLLVVEGEASSDDGQDEPPVADEPLDALPTAAKVLVNGEEVAFEAYNINGSNYFKLRDLAMALNGSEKNFGVEWDAEANAIKLTSATEYVPAGNELALSDNPVIQRAIATSSTIYIDSVEVTVTAYNINDSNYFELRDITRAFNIGVDWIEETQTISIDTSKDYIE